MTPYRTRGIEREPPPKVDPFWLRRLRRADDRVFHPDRFFWAIGLFFACIALMCLWAR